MQGYFAKTEKKVQRSRVYKQSHTSGADTSTHSCMTTNHQHKSRVAQALVTVLELAAVPAQSFEVVALV